MFPSPGNHQWPDNQVKLRACATSGLPVTYEVESGCDVVDSTSTTLRGRQYALLDCDIIARQAGNAEYAPAASVTRTWRVGRMATTIAILAPSPPLQYEDADVVVTVNVRVTSKHPLPGIAVNMGTEGQCNYEGGGRSVPTEGKRDVTFGIPLKLKDPGPQSGTCTLTVNLNSNSVNDGSKDVRALTVLPKSG